MAHRVSTRALGVLVALCFGALLSPVGLTAQDDAARRQLSRYAERQWGPWTNERQRVRGVEMVRDRSGAVFAVVMHPRHVSWGGAYNYPGAVLRLAGGRVTETAFTTAPGWARDAMALLVFREPALGQAAWNPSLSRTARGEVELSVAMAGRGLGDSAEELRFRWTARGWVPTEHRSRDGGAAFYAETGPHPIVAPPSRRCAPRLEVAEPYRLRLVAERPNGREASTLLRVRRRLADCRSQRDTMDCGAEPARPETSYTAVAVDGRWRVMAVPHHGGRTSRALEPSLPIGCAL